MSHISRVVATALATALSAKSWTALGGTTEVAMRRRPDYGLEDLGSLLFSVVPGPVKYTTETRQMEVAEVMVAVEVAKHVGSESDIAALEDLEQEIIDAIRSGAVAPAGLPDGSDWVEVENTVPFSPDELVARNVFMGQVTVNYKIPMDRN
jgi:hypothetical protein